jgi:long-chain acyl-CoA synthetase
MTSVALKSTPISAANLPALVLARALADPQRTILRKKRFGIWRQTSGADLTKAVADCASGLVALGLRPGDTAGILAAPGPEWIVADLGIQSSGAISAGFHAETAPGELLDLIRRCAPRVLFVDGAALYDAIDLRTACADVRTIVCIDAVAAAEVADEHVISFDALIAKGAASLQRNEAPWGALVGDAVGAILPTSGSSGPSRGARLTHRALAAAVEASLSMIDLREGDERLSLMPASHSFERIFGLYASLAAGVVVNFPESADTAFENLRELQPQIVSGPPALWRRILRRLRLASSEATSFQRTIFERAVKSGGALANLLVLNKVRRDLGLVRVRVALSGGAPLPRDIRDGFTELGIDIADVYTLAEVGPVAIATESPRDFVFARGVEVALGADGEARLRTSAGFAGYVGGDAADEWLSTGDVAAKRREGITLLGSRDAVVETDRTALWSLEETIAASPYIDACIVSGADRAKLSALLLIDYDNVVRYAQARATPFTHYKSLAEAADVRALLEAEIEKANAAIAPCRIASFTVSDRAVTPGDPALGPGSALRRRIALQSLSGRGN